MLDLWTVFSPECRLSLKLSFTFGDDTIAEKKNEHKEKVLFMWYIKRTTEYRCF